MMTWLPALTKTMLVLLLALATLAAMAYDGLLVIGMAAAVPNGPWWLLAVLSGAVLATGGRLLRNPGRHRQHDGRCTVCGAVVESYRVDCKACRAEWGKRSSRPMSALLMTLQFGGALGAMLYGVRAASVLIGGANIGQVGEFVAMVVSCGLLAGIANCVERQAEHWGWRR